MSRINYYALFIQLPKQTRAAIILLGYGRLRDELTKYQIQAMLDALGNKFFKVSVVQSSAIKGWVRLVKKVVVTINKSELERKIVQKLKRFPKLINEIRNMLETGSCDSCFVVHNYIDAICVTCPSFDLSTAQCSRYNTRCNQCSYVKDFIAKIKEQESVSSEEA